MIKFSIDIKLKSTHTNNYVVACIHASIGIACLERVSGPNRQNQKVDRGTFSCWSLTRIRVGRCRPARVFA